MATLFNRLKSTIAYEVTAFFCVTNPMKTLEYYRFLFETSSAIATGNGTVSHFRFRVYFLLFVYLSVLQLVFYFLFPCLTDNASKLFFIRLLFVDWLFIINGERDKQFYLFFVCLIGYTVYLHWALYYGDNHRINRYIEEILFGDDDVGCELSKLTPTKVAGVCSEGKIKSINNSINRAQFRRITLTITHFMGLFIVIFDIALFGFFVAFVQKLFIQSQQSYFLTLADNLYPPFNQPFLLFLILLPVLLIHLFIFFALWITFCQTTFVSANFCIISLVYFHLTYRQHYKQLKTILNRCQVMRRWHLLVCSISTESNNRRFYQHYHRHHHQYSYHHLVVTFLRRNLQLFEVLFLGDAFFGQVLTTYLAVHLPTSAYLAIEIIFDKIDSGLLLFVLLGLSAEALTGNMAIHYGMAWLSSFVHKGEKILVSFTARTCTGNESSCYRLPPRAALTVHLHITRLLVRKKYGITYWVLGTLVSLKAFTKCLLLYGEFLMYDYTLIRNAQNLHF